MLIHPRTPVLSLIQNAQDQNVINTFSLGKDVAAARPEAFLAVGTGYERMQLLFETLDTVLLVYSLNNHTIRLKKKIYTVSERIEGYNASKVFVFSLLEKAFKTGYILSVYFSEWTVQQRHAALCIAATGARNCDKVKEYLLPVLAQEQKQYENKAVGTFNDLPENFIPKE